MTFGQKPTERKFLDGEKCLQLWLQLDSLAKAQAALARDGVFSNRTGKAPSRSGIEHSAKRWILRNANDARVKYIEPFKNSRGRILTDEIWEEYLVEIAVHNLTSAGYVKYIEKNGLQDATKRSSEKL